MKSGCCTKQGANLSLHVGLSPIECPHSGPSSKQRQRYNPTVTEGPEFNDLCDLFRRASDSEMGPDRRSAPRYRFIAEAEIIETFSDSRLKAQTSDLSIGGCFLDMLNPSPKGTEIRVTISHAGTAFTALGRVVFCVPSLGMGVAFTNVDGNQVAVLQKWLLEAKGESDSGNLKAADGSIGRSGT